MPLSCAFAFDTETDIMTEGDEPQLVMIQCCPISAVSRDEVILYEGIDCYDVFFNEFEETMWDCRCFMFNLGGYEFSYLKRVLIRRYEFVKWKGKLKKGQWSLIGDAFSTYAVKIVNQYGNVLYITDDKKLVMTDMKTAGDAVRKDHPEWFSGETKEETEYNNGWYREKDTDVEKYLRFREYGITDCFTQAMIAKWLDENGRHDCLTSASNGFVSALNVAFNNGSGMCHDRDRRRRNKMDFRKYYPPLSKEMHLIAENSLLGGFVYGRVGMWRGRFVHVDYSSSYPHEYANERLFRGKVERVMYGDRDYEMIERSDAFKWYLVSFSFELKENGMPAISCSECDMPSHKKAGNYSSKMRTGKVSRRLYTEKYLEELKKHYDMDIEVHELWYAKPFVGEFRKFIELCYDMKSSLPDGMERSLWKLDMNGGCHGKPMTKIQRKERTFYDGVEKLEDVCGEPQYCILLGFSAMMNARARLLGHCRMLTERGLRVMMCDTDSIVCEGSEEEVRDCIGDWFTVDGEGFANIGKFEFEKQKRGNGKGTVEFDEFRCWGLKRYCELNNGEYRKSAFAGMFDENQEKWLPEWDLSDKTIVQERMRDGKYGKHMVYMEQRIEVKDIWYVEESVPKVSDMNWKKYVKSVKLCDMSMKDSMNRDVIGC